VTQNRRVVVMDKEESTSARSGSTDEQQSKDFAKDPPRDQGGDEPKEKRTWFQKLNPFYSGEVPPVPAVDAGLVPEMHAGFLSKLTWGWMSSLMMVSPPRPVGMTC
jgi:hypothetical protein